MPISKVTITDDCTGCGLCEETCPEVFKVNDIAAVREGADIAANEEKIKEAAENCPLEAIKVE